MKIVETAEQKLVKKPVIARRYDVNERTIHEWMKNGTIPFLKIGYMVRFNPDDCDRALARFRTNIGAVESCSA